MWGNIKVNLKVKRFQISECVNLEFNRVDWSIRIAKRRENLYYKRRKKCLTT